MKNKNLMIYVVTFGVGLILGIILHQLYLKTFPTSDIGANFVKTCSDLTGQNLTFENVRKLKGRVYVSINRKDDKYYKSNQQGSSIGLLPLEKKFIDQYKDSFYKLLDDSITHVNVHERSFDVSRGDLDGDWRCNISLDDKTQKIKANSYYQSD